MFLLLTIIYGIRIRHGGIERIVYQGYGGDTETCIPGVTDCTEFHLSYAVGVLNLGIDKINKVNKNIDILTFVGYLLSTIASGVSFILLRKNKRF